MHPIFLLFITLVTGAYKLNQLLSPIGIGGQYGRYKIIIAGFVFENEVFDQFGEFGESALLVRRG